MLKSIHCLSQHLLLLLGIGLAPWVAQAESRISLCIGIDTYRSPVIVNLDGAANDARCIGSVLENYGGFCPPSGRSTVLTSSDAGNNATRSKILKAIDHLAAEIKKDDVFVFYFAGHGLVRDGESYLLASDSEIGQGSVDKTAISASLLNRHLSRVSAAKKVLIFDACRNDPFPSRSGGAVLDKQFSRGLRVISKYSKQNRNTQSEFTAVLYACGVGERAFECPSTEPVQGYFSFYLAHLLRSAVQRREQHYSIQDLVSDLESEVARATRRDLGVEQKPWADISGRFVSQWSLLAPFYRVKPIQEKEPDPSPIYSAPTEKDVGKGSLSITSQPSGAEIILNGKNTGKRTPTTLSNLPARKSVVALKKARYIPEVKNVVILPGKTETLSIRMQKTRELPPPVFGL